VSAVDTQVLDLLKRPDGEKLFVRTGALYFAWFHAAWNVNEPASRVRRRDCLRQEFDGPEGG
jgi:hypothetical protein